MLRLFRVNINIHCIGYFSNPETTDKNVHYQDNIADDFTHLEIRLFNVSARYIDYEKLKPQL